MRLILRGSPPVAEVGRELVRADGGVVASHDDALAQGLAHGQAWAAAQFGQPDQQQAQALLGVHAE